MPDSVNPLELDAETMRRLGYQVIDRLVDRIATLDRAPAWRGAPRAELEKRLLEAPPEHGQEFDVLLDRLYADVLDFAARVDHPRFLAFVPGAPTWPGILGDLISAGHNIFQGTWLGSSGPSMLELVVLDWFKQWIGYPAQATGLLLSGGSAANLTALACARANRGDKTSERNVLYFSAESHSSVSKAARALGFGEAQLRALAPDAQLRLDLGSLRDAIRSDRARGLHPLAIIANAGATSTGAVDPLAEAASLAHDEGLWLHVDAAYGGFAILTERGRRLLTGIELADSVTLDPHKWLYQPFEVGCLLVRAPGNLERTFHTMPAYLQDTAIAGGEVNFGDRGVQLTRSARVLKIWLSLQYFGLHAFRQAIDFTLDLATHAEQRVRRSDRFQLLSNSSLGIVCFRRLWSQASEEVLDERNAALTRKLADSGLALISSTRVDGKYALRVCILNHRTTRADVDRVFDFLEQAD